MSMQAVATDRTVRDTDNDIRVMIVDDSVVVRGLVSRWVAAVPGLQVVSKQSNGALAVKDVAVSDPDVVVLDVEMPEMDGLTALPKMLEIKPDLKVIMASTLTRRNAEISLKALSLGATDYVPKPETNSGITTSDTFRLELVDKIKALGQTGKARRARVRTPAAQEPVSKSTATVPSSEKFELRRFNPVVPKIVVIGSSTGGPQALFEVTKSIGPSIGRVPVVITQHMPPTFTAILSEHIGKSSGKACKEAEDGELLLPGHIYVAKGGLHLTLAKAANGICAKLEDGPPVNFCKPAVDPLFVSAIEVCGSAVLGVILTGMGHDGRDGATRIADAGGNVIAQDKGTSVVWGMPGAAATAGACAAVLPLGQIGPRIVRALSGVA